MQKRPGKIHTTVSSDEFGGAQLMYHRHRSDEWRLVIYVGRDDFVVSETNVENKARAAALLPDLIDTMLRSKDERLQMVNTALERLHSIPFLKDISEK